MAQCKAGSIHHLVVDAEAKKDTTPMIQLA